MNRDDQVLQPPGVSWLFCPERHPTETFEQYRDRRLAANTEARIQRKGYGPGRVPAPPGFSSPRADMRVATDWPRHPRPTGKAEGAMKRRVWRDVVFHEYRRVKQQALKAQRRPG